jgi:membrane-bound ClpP family serine protease
MNALLKRSLSLALGLLLSAVLLLSCPARALAADTIVLKDGTKIEGTITDEKPEFVWITIKFGELKKPRLVNRTDIKDIVREKPATDAAATSTDPKAPAKVDGKKDDEKRPALNNGATRVAVISQEEMVGPFMNAEAFKYAVDLIPKDQKPDIVIMRINSGGGALNEVPKLMDLIQKDLKPHYRVVAWIESAISAAAMTAMNTEEIYMMKRGNLGGAVAFSTSGGKATAMKDEGLEMVLKLGEQIAKNGRYDPLVIRAMQEFMPLSANIDADGRVTWQADDKGQFLVNRKDRILTFNAEDALKFKISKGTADTLPELMSLLGVQEYVEVGNPADKHMVEFRENVQKAQVEIAELRQKLNFIIGNASNLRDKKDRDREFGKAKNFVDQMKSWVRKAPSLEVYEGLDEDRFREIYEQIERLRQGKSAQ